MVSLISWKATASLLGVKNSTRRSSRGGCATSAHPPPIYMSSALFSAEASRIPLDFLPEVVGFDRKGSGVRLARLATGRHRCSDGHIPSKRTRPGRRAIARLPGRTRRSIPPDGRGHKARHRSSTARRDLDRDGIAVRVAGLNPYVGVAAYIQMSGRTHDVDHRRVVNLHRLAVRVYARRASWTARRWRGIAVPLLRSGNDVSASVDHRYIRAVGVDHDDRAQLRGTVKGATDRLAVLLGSVALNNAVACAVLDLIRLALHSDRNTRVIAITCLPLRAVVACRWTRWCRRWCRARHFDRVCDVDRDSRCHLLTYEPNALSERLHANLTLDCADHRDGDLLARRAHDRTRSRLRLLKWHGEDFRLLRDSERRPRVTLRNEGVRAIALPLHDDCLGRADLQRDLPCRDGLPVHVRARHDCAGTCHAGRIVVVLADGDLRLGDGGDRGTGDLVDRDAVVHCEPGLDAGIVRYQLLDLLLGRRLARRQTIG